MLVEGRCQARIGKAFSRNAGARASKPLEQTTPGTPPGPRDHGFVSEKATGKLQFEHRKMGFTSRGASVCRRRDRPIHKKIIGRRVSVLRSQLGGRIAFLRARGTFPKLHQPAGQHGGGIFIHPLIDECRDFLSKIRGVTEARKLVALKRGPGSGKKELPRRLRLLTDHLGLLLGTGCVS